MGEHLTLTDGIILYFCVAIPVALAIAIRRTRRGSRILRRGELVAARVVELRDTGARDDRAVVADLTLDIERPEPDGRPRRVVTRFTVPELAPSRFQPGCEVQVRVDPADPGRVLVDRGAMGV